GEGPPGVRARGAGRFDHRSQVQHFLILGVDVARLERRAERRRVAKIRDGAYLEAEIAVLTGVDRSPDHDVLTGPVGRLLVALDPDEATAVAVGEHPVTPTFGTVAQVDDRLAADALPEVGQFGKRLVEPALGLPAKLLPGAVIS